MKKIKKYIHGGDHEDEIPWKSWTTATPSDTTFVGSSIDMAHAMRKAKDKARYYRSYSLDVPHKMTVTQDDLGRNVYNYHITKEKLPQDMPETYKYGGDQIPEANFGGLLGGALSGLAGAIPGIGGIASKGVANIASSMGADMTSPEAQMGKFMGGIGATAINPSSAPTNLLSMFAKNGGKYMFGGNPNASMNPRMEKILQMSTEAMIPNNMKRQRYPWEQPGYLGPHSPELYAEDGGKFTKPPFMRVMNPSFTGPAEEPIERINELKEIIKNYEEEFNKGYDYYTRVRLDNPNYPTMDVKSYKHYEDVIKAQEELERLTGKKSDSYKSEILYIPERSKDSRRRRFGYNKGGKVANVDFEAEDGEVIVGDVKVNRAYNGGTMKSYKGGGMHVLSGPRHSGGGIGIMQFGGNPSYVFSNNKDLKVPKEFGKFGTYADAAKGMAKDLENIAEMRMGGEGYDRTTANMMETLAMGEVKNLYDAQEKFKADNNIQNPVKMALFGDTFDPTFNFDVLNTQPDYSTIFNTGNMGSYSDMQGNTWWNQDDLDYLEGLNQEEDEKLPGWMKAAAVAPGLFNMAKGLFGKAPTMDLGRLDPQDYQQKYMDFSPMEQRYMNMQGRNLHSLRRGLEGSGATGAQLRGGLQAGHSKAQTHAGDFFSGLSQQKMQDRRAVDSANVATNLGIADKNMRRELMEDQFMMQHDPAQSFATGLEGLGSSLVNLGMDHLRLQNMDTANYGAYGDFKNYKFDPITGEELI